MCTVPQPDQRDDLPGVQAVLRGGFLQLSLTSDLPVDVARTKKKNKENLLLCRGLNCFISTHQ